MNSHLSRCSSEHAHLHLYVEPLFFGTFEDAHIAAPSRVCKFTFLLHHEYVYIPPGSS
jgi:hypothetical protein